MWCGQYENAEGTFKTKEATETNKNKYVAVSISSRQREVTGT